MKPWVRGLSSQSEGFKTSFSCLWLPVSLCTETRVHSLLSVRPQSSSIDSIILSVTVAPGTETCPMVCFLTPGG